MDTNENYLQPKTRKSKASNVIPNENFGLDAQQSEQSSVGDWRGLRTTWLWSVKGPAPKTFPVTG